MASQIRDNEYVKRTMISDMGVKNTERLNVKSDKKNSNDEDEEYECSTCSANLYVSFVSYHSIEAGFFSENKGRHAFALWLSEQRL
jgi:hypothetical protein